MKQHPLASSLMISSIGWFPRAAHHFIDRPKGIDSHILILCVAGSGWYAIDGVTRHLNPGEALLIPLGKPHAYGADASDPWSIHWIHFTGELAGYYPGYLPDREYHVPLAPDCLRELVHLFRCGCAAVRNQYSESGCLYLAQLVHHLLGTLFFHNRAYSPDRRHPASHDIQDTLAYLVAHCTEPLSLRDLARHAGLSVAHFSMLFQQQTGTPPIQYVAQQRMRRACQLMDTTSLTIREVAERVGYDDPYYFSRAFRRLMGLAPRQYRKMHKG